jgi:hypothetical protein
MADSIVVNSNEKDSDCTQEGSALKISCKDEDKYSDHGKTHNSMNSGEAVSYRPNEEVIRESSKCEMVGVKGSIDCDEEDEEEEKEEGDEEEEEDDDDDDGHEDEYNGEDDDDDDFAEADEIRELIGI